MTFKYNNVYIKDSYTIAGMYESDGPLKKYLEENINDWQKIKSLLEKVLTTNINQ